MKAVFFWDDFSASRLGAGISYLKLRFSNKLGMFQTETRLVHWPENIYVHNPPKPSYPGCRVPRVEASNYSSVAHTRCGDYPSHEVPWICFPSL